MATVAQAVSVPELTGPIIDWNTNPQSVENLLPLLRACREDLQAPQGYEFALRAGDLYFVRFHHSKRGSALSKHSQDAMRATSLAAILTFFAFIQREAEFSPLANADFSVELIKERIVKHGYGK